MNKLKLFALLTACLFTFGAFSSAHATVVSLTAIIDGSQANAGLGTGSVGMGSASMTLDDATNQFIWNIEWSGLVGNVSVAHFHGPASPDQNAGVQVSIDIGTNPARGDQILSGTQASNLLDGLWYINIHSDVSPGGEIRGQVNVVPIPAAAGLFFTGMLGLYTLAKRKKP